MKLSLALSSAALAALCAVALPAVAQQRVFTASLSGAAEAPPVASNGFGTAIVTFDLGAGTMRLQTLFGGLTGLTTVAHIHCCTATPLTGVAGVATTTPSFPGFPVNATFGSYDQTFNMTLSSSYNPGFITANGGTPLAAWNALLGGVAQGRSYLNIHSTYAPGGEIRGFLTPVPEASTYAMMLGGLAFIGAAARRRRQATV
ncbi:MAG: CHRD domain-containing protein [Rubrivivax sp.]|nr:CHRD domain-containing protein [Rubrivivax sp.]